MPFSPSSPFPPSTGRPILPKPSSGSGEEDDTNPPPVPAPLVKKPVKVGVACDQCRVKRTKCNGQKPSCSRCSDAGRTCTYRPAGGNELKRKHQDLQKTSQDLENVLDLLRSAPDETAATLFLALRSGASVGDILGSVNGRSRLSHAQSSRSTSIPTASTLEFYLNTNHTNAFPGLEPLQLADVDLKLLGVGGSDSVPGRPPKRPRPPERAAASDPLAIVAGPGLPYIDSRLNSLNIQQWTDIPISNSLAARVISFYLANEHPILGPFCPELFVGDLISGSTRFCSPLLVSALLAWSCGPYAQFQPELKSLSREFLEEAKVRWESRDEQNHTTVSAAFLLTIACNHHGEDKAGVFYLDTGAEIGHQLGLFNQEPDQKVSILPYGDQDQRAASFAAWGIFGWHTLHALYFRRRHAIYRPPTLPIPGGAAMPHYMGWTFAWVSSFWLTVHEIFQPTDFRYGSISLADAEVGYQKLLSLFDTVPNQASRSDSCPQHVIILHSWYHTAILDLWRPFLETKQSTKLETLPSSDAYPAAAAYDASVRQLKRLIYINRARFDATNLTILFSPGYLYLLNEVYRNSDTPDAQFYFILAMRGYLRMAPWSAVMCGVAKAFFALGWKTGIIQRLGWADRLLEDMQAASAAAGVEEDYKSLYPVDLEGVNKDVEEGSMEKLAKGFQKLALENEAEAEAQGEGQEKPEGWTGNPEDLKLTLGEEVDVDQLLDLEDKDD